MIQLFIILMKVLASILWMVSCLPMAIAVVLLGRGRIIDNCLKDMFIGIWYGE